MLQRLFSRFVNDAPPKIGSGTQVWRRASQDKPRVFHPNDMRLDMTTKTIGTLAFIGLAIVTVAAASMTVPIVASAPAFAKKPKRNTNPAGAALKGRTKR